MFDQLGFLDAIEVIIIVAIIITQLYIAYNLWQKIEQYKAIFDFEDLPIVTQKKVAINVLKNGSIRDILTSDEHDENNSTTQVNITYLAYKKDSIVLSAIVKYINVYLIKNKGASIDFHLIKDIVEKHTTTIENEIENRIPAPLYLGLSATMIGIIVGLLSVDFSGGVELNAVQPLIDGVKWAMTASVFGLIITTIFSIKIYKDAQIETDEEKSEFLSKLQSELMPKMAKGKLPEVAILSEKLDAFAISTNTTVSQLEAIVKTSSQSILLESQLLKQISNLDIKGITNSNVVVFNKLEEMMGSFDNFAGYYQELNQSMTSTSQLLANLKQFVDSTQNVNGILESLKGTIESGNQATSFFNKHIKSFEKYGDSVNEAVVKTDSSFKEAFDVLTKTADGQIESFKEVIATFDSDLSRAFSTSVDNFTKTMDTQVIRTEEAFENSRPKFEMLEKLNRIENLEKGIENLENKLISGNNEIVQCLKQLNDTLINNVSSPNIINTPTPANPPVEQKKPNIIENILKYGAYSVIIIYGIHSLMAYFKLMSL